MMLSSSYRASAGCRRTCLEQIRHASKAAGKSNKKLDTIPSMTIAEALRYLRAAEAGYSTKALHLAIRLKTDKASKPLRGSISLPRPLPSKVKIAVFARDQDAAVARQAGAYLVGAEDLVKRISDGKIDFDKCISTPECLPLLSRLARTLGPKGLMPTVKRGTVVKDVATAIAAANTDLDFRQKSGPVVRMPVAQTTFSDEEITKNIEASLRAVAKVGETRDDSGKGASTIEQVIFSSTHGPGIPLSIASAR